MRILLADSEPLECNAVMPLVAGWGHRLTLAANGAQALQRLLRGEPPDLVLASRLLPGMDGLSLTRWIRAHSTLHQPRVVILSHQDGEPLMRAARAAGADTLLRKPCSAEQLKEQFALAEIGLRRAAEVRRFRLATTLPMAALPARPSAPAFAARAH
jgi:CheY-like chemotaxis protein